MSPPKWRQASRTKKTKEGKWDENPTSGRAKGMPKALGHDTCGEQRLPWETDIGWTVRPCPLRDATDSCCRQFALVGVCVRKCFVCVVTLKTFRDTHVWHKRNRHHIHHHPRKRFRRPVWDTDWVAAPQPDLLWDRIGRIFWLRGNSKSKGEYQSAKQDKSLVSTMTR